jgi:crotonobetainyl-CoA:carnitine CoA-transferase CaiB-like acyl-CoA transferase
MTDGALSNLRVVELAQGIAGPYCGKLFSDLGASVIKIEPSEGDRSRRYGPFPNDEPDPEKSGFYLHLNTGKKSLTLDTSVTSGQVILKKLLANVDVLIEDETSRIDDALAAEFPNLVRVTITPFGLTGPYAGYRGNSLTAMAMSTIMYSTGEPDREPLTTGGTPADYIAGIHGWIGALAALESRAREGKGQHVDVAVADAAACADEYNAAMYGFQGAIRRRYYSRHIFGYPYDILPCKDGYVVVVPGANGFPQRGMAESGSVSPMALLMGDPELDKTEFFQSGQARMVRWQEFDELMLPWLKEHDAAEIVEIAQALRMPFAIVPTVQDLLADPHLAERAFFERIEHPQAGELTYAGAPFRMSETPPAIERAPTLGEHNESLLSELGYSKDDQGILHERGVS